MPQRIPSLVLHFINTTTFAARDFRPRRGASDAHTLQESVRREQRRLGRKEPPPAGLRRFSVLALLLVGHSPTAGDAPSSRLARAEKRRNKRGRIYETEYLAFRISSPLSRGEEKSARACERTNHAYARFICSPLRASVQTGKRGPVASLRRGGIATAWLIFTQRRC